MAMKAWFDSKTSLGLIRQYLRERVCRWRILALLVFLLVMSASLSEYWDGLTDEEPPRVLLMFLLMLTFRLLDDLKDRPYDRIHHPERLLSRIDDVRSFKLLLVLLIVITSLWIGLVNLSAHLSPLVGAPLIGSGTPSGSIWKFVLYIALLVLLGLWYRYRKALRNSPLNATVILLKYPLFVWIVTNHPTSPGRLTLGLLLVYVSLWIFEYLHDPSHRSAWIKKGLSNSHVARQDEDRS